MICAAQPAMYAAPMPTAGAPMAALTATAPLWRQPSPQTLAFAALIAARHVRSAPTAARVGAMSPGRSTMSIRTLVASMPISAPQRVG